MRTLLASKEVLPRLSIICLSLWLAGCNGDEIAAQRCTAPADPAQLDCRSNSGDTGGSGDDSSNSGGGTDGGSGGSTDGGGTTDGSGSSGTTVVTTLKGMVIGAGNQPLASSTVCFDLNDDGLCSTELEPYTTTASDGSFSFGETAVQRGYGATLRAEARNGSQLSYTLAALTPPQAAIKASDGVLSLAITPFSTLLASEVEFNPGTVQQTEQARTALLALLPQAQANWLDSQAPLTEWDESGKRCASALVDGFIAAQAGTGSLAAIAAVTDQVASQKRCQVTVSSEQLQSQQRFFTPASMTLGESLSWPIEYKDEYSLGLYANSQYGLVYSKFHNRLVSLDLTSGTPSLLDGAQFAHVTGAQHAIDGVTGASEQLLDAVVLSQDSHTLFATVKLAGDNPGNTVGIYRGDSSDMANLPIRTAANFVAGSEFYPYPKVRCTALSADGSRLATGGEDNQIHLLNSADLSELGTLNLGGVVRSVAFSQDGRTLYAGIAKSGTQSAAIVVLAVSDSTVTELARYTESATAIQLVPLHSGTALAYVLSASTRYGVLDITTPAKPTLLRSYQAGGKVTALTETPDGQALLVATNNRLVERVDARTLQGTPAPVRVASLTLAPNAIAAPKANAWLVGVKNGLQPVQYQASQIRSLDAAALASWQSSHRP